MLEVVGAEVGEVADGLGAGVVDENVDRAVGLLHVADQGAQGVAVGEVGGHGVGAQVGGECGEGLGPAGDEREARPGIREVGGEAPPDVTGGSGEQDVGSGNSHPSSVVHGGSVATIVSGLGVGMSNLGRAAAPGVPVCGMADAPS